MNKRYHPPARIAEHPAVQQAFLTIGAILISTKGTDLEADFIVEGSQFHIDVSEVARHTDEIQPKQST